METTNTATNLLTILFTGGVLGILGQGFRILIGLKKLDQQRAINGDESETFTTNRLLTSIFFGFMAGALAILIKWETMLTFNKELILGLMAAGYAGADFIEGLFNTYFKKINPTSQVTEIPSRSTLEGVMRKFGIRKTYPLEYEVKKRILAVKGDFSSNPNDLENASDLMENLLYNNYDFLILAMKLNELITKPTNKITASEITNCSTVADCISLVKNKI